MAAGWDVRSGRAPSYGLVPVVHGAEERRRRWPPTSAYLEQGAGRGAGAQWATSRASSNRFLFARCVLERGRGRAGVPDQPQHGAGYVTPEDPVGFTVPVFARRAKRIAGHLNSTISMRGVSKRAAHGPLDRAEEIAGRL